MFSIAYNPLLVPGVNVEKSLGLSTFLAMGVISLRPTRNNQYSWEYKGRLILIHFAIQVVIHSFHGNNSKLIINNYVGYFYTYI